MSWPDFEALLAIRGDRAGVRMDYLDGAMELTSPAKMREARKTMLARLLEQWALERDVVLEGFGSWTLKQELREAGAEPDECYVVGSRDKDAPDLVVEVEWSRAPGLVKHEIHRRLGVRELWTLKTDAHLVLRVLQRGDWVEVTDSKLLPKARRRMARFVPRARNADGRIARSSRSATRATVGWRGAHGFASTTGHCVSSTAPTSPRLTDA